MTNATTLLLPVFLLATIFFAPLWQLLYRFRKAAQLPEPTDRELLEAGLQAASSQNLIWPSTNHVETKPRSDLPRVSFSQVKKVGEILHIRAPFHNLEISIEFDEAGRPVCLYRLREDCAKKSLPQRLSREEIQLSLALATMMQNKKNQ